MNLNPRHHVLAPTAPFAQPSRPPAPFGPVVTRARVRWWTPSRMAAILFTAVSGLVLYGTNGALTIALRLLVECENYPSANVCLLGIAQWRFNELASRYPAIALTAFAAVIVPACLVERHPRLA
ncbi:hypothetical protein, partial [Pengzhenrongella sp.]|uniref:hypothetical protein n=1 Tax=Pengzhenrongella sp. TaxID=2888820 RepID=UPI002F959CB8